MEWIELQPSQHESVEVKLCAGEVLRGQSHKGHDGWVDMVGVCFDLE